MSVVEFLKSVGGVTLPDEVIRQAKQNQEEQRQEEDRKKRQAEASEQKESKNQ